jgi:small GTP-binding protein
MKRVLIVEDDPSMKFLLKDGLIDLGAKFYVETAPSGEAALEKLSQGHWDLVVTDNRMPGMSGLQLIEVVKERAPATLTILITAYGSEEVEQAARRLNVYHYMAKPFPLADLKRVIEDALTFSQPGDPPPNSNNNHKARGLKITLGGEGNVGKTTLIRRLCTGKFEAARVMTIGVDFHLYDIQQDSRQVRLIVWDVGGQEQFSFTRCAFYRGSKAVGLVYDVSDHKTFERLIYWRDEIHSILPHVPLVIIGNKIDLVRQVSHEEGMMLASEWNVPFFETSCVDGKGVQEVFLALADLAIKYSNSTSK